MTVILLHLKGGERLEEIWMADVEADGRRGLKRWTREFEEIQS